MASTSRDHRLVSLRLDSDGIPFFKCIASELGLKEAMRLTRSGRARPGSVLFAGHPGQFAVCVDVHAGECNGWCHEQRARLEATITAWLHSLRSCGALAFSSMVSGAVVRVDRCFGTAPSLLSSYLRGLPPDGDEAGRQLDPVGMTRDAPASSMLGIVRHRADTARLFAWMRNVGHPQQLACLSQPLFGQATQTELEAMQLRFAAWWQGDWRWMGTQPVCSVHMVAVDLSARLVTATCVTAGMTAWSIDAMWAALSSPIDPAFDVAQGVAKADPLNMPGQLDRLWHAMFRHWLEPVLGIHVLSRNLHNVIESTLREARFPMRIDLLSSLDIESFAMAGDMEQYNGFVNDGLPSEAPP